METESIPQHCSQEDVPSSLPSTHPTDLRECADDAECEQQISVSTSAVSETKSPTMQPINSSQSETLGDTSAPSLGVSEKEVKDRMMKLKVRAKAVVDALLARCGSSKERILMVQVYLPNISRDFAGMNKAYEAWVAK